ncbi:hypothetical protein GH741_14040 [Aquibacillus halophilus]|uniref:Uncharacterized protein n=1 Tax=Aquibacillus halophilus TaxID=930132 RepID=A0A6A8DE01_9BACI|nr:hypothetical protein [Aquibacillus halophilus]MRH43794.1 hypothetical protein [Aquibacillus halophilus]
MRERFLWAGITVIIMSWFGNYLYFQSQQLDEPIFLDHYYQMYHSEAVQEIPLTFYYLANKQNPMEVNYIEMNGIEAYPVSNNVGFTMFNNNQPQINYRQEFTHHYLMEVTVTIRNDMDKVVNENDEAWSFNTMDVYFSNGEHINANIGEVVIQSHHNQPLVLDTRSGGSSNQHRSAVSMVANQPIRIQDISVPFDRLTDDVSIKVGLNEANSNKMISSPGVNQALDLPWEELQAPTVEAIMFPFDLAKNDFMGLYMQFDSNRTSYYQFDIQISGTRDDGQPFVSGVPINDQPYLDENDLDAIIETKGGNMR